MIQVKHPVSKELLEGLIAQLIESGAENYQEQVYDLDIGSEQLTACVTLQKRGKPAAHELRIEAEQKCAELEAKLAKWISVFGHLGTPDEAGNTLIAKQDELEAEVAKYKAASKGLTEVGALIHTQDNRGTDQPLFAVMEKREMVTLDSHDHDRIVWVETKSGDYREASRSHASRLEKQHNAGDETPGWERYAVKEIDVFVTACFTEQGCKDFIAADGHNHRKPYIDAYGSYRNTEYQAVRNWLLTNGRDT